MTSISPILNSVVDYCIKKPTNRLARTRLLKNVCKSYESNALTAIAGWAIASVILKDGLGCYMYVKQSLNNKDIPDDKRKFVAALDLANGGLMIAAQILMFLTISHPKIQEKMFNKFFGKYFNRVAQKSYQAVIKHKEEFKNLTGKEFNVAYEKFHKNIKDTFGFFVTLMASTILAKRVIVPFISTPLADYTKQFLGKDKAEHKDGDKFETQAKK